MENTKQKNNSVINVRLPEEMKEQLKQKLGYNMSGIMKEHFQKLLDVKDYENRNSCWGCKEMKQYDECSFAILEDEDETMCIHIFCKECLTKEAPDILEGDEIKIFNYIKELAKTNKHPEHLPGLSKMCNDHTKDKGYKGLCEIGQGTLYFTNEFKSQMDKLKNGESTHTHKS